jgi:hypothetical protein
MYVVTAIEVVVYERVSPMLKTEGQIQVLAVAANVSVSSRPRFLISFCRSSLILRNTLGSISIVCHRVVSVLRMKAENVYLPPPNLAHVSLRVQLCHQA